MIVAKEFMIDMDRYQVAMWTFFSVFVVKVVGGILIKMPSTLLFSLLKAAQNL